MHYLKSYVVVVGVMLLLVVGCEPKARVTIRAVDDDGQPVSNASVSISFEHALNPHDFTTLTGKTDSAGFFHAESATSGDIGYRVTKTGYYPSMDGHNATDTPGPAGEGYLGPQRLPMNTTQTLILRKIANPIPLAAKTIILTSTNRVGEAGCDLIAGDWLPPFGAGTNADFFFRWSYQWNAWNDREGQLTLSFPNPGDGLIVQPHSRSSGSELRMKHHAPDGGYEAKPREWREDFTPRKRNYDYQDRFASAYFFRIRTQTNNAGQVTRAFYGKTDGDIFFHGASEDGTGVEFIYYLNPTPNDRNLEFDGKKNLFDPPGALSK